MELLRKYLWLWILTAVVLLSFIIALIFYLINKCITKQGKQILHLDKRFEFHGESHKHPVRSLTVSTPPLPPRTQFLTEECQSYENLADGVDYVEPDQNLKDGVDYVEPDQNLKDGVDYEEPDQNLKDGVDYVEPDPNLTDGVDYIEPDPNLTDGVDYVEPDPNLADGVDYVEPDPNLTDGVDYVELDSNLTDEPDYEDPDLNVGHDFEQDRFGQNAPEQPMYLKVQCEQKAFTPSLCKDPVDTSSNEDYDDIGDEDEEDYDDVI